MTVIVIHSSQKDRGGVMNAAVSHAHGLMAAGYAAELWTASKKAEANALALSVPALRADVIANPIKALFSAELRRRRREIGPVSAVLHQGARSWSWAWALWPSAVHAVRFPNYRIGDRRLFRNWLAISSRHADALRREKTLGWRRPRVEVICNGDSQSALRETRPRRPFRADGRFVIGALGKLSERKGQDVLVAALAKLRAGGLDAVVRLGGAGGDRREALEAQARALGVADYVEMPGWVDAVSFLADIDVFCLPSRSEPFGIVVIEAMTQGAPVVSSDVDGPADILAGGAGVLTPPGDAHALAAALAALAAAPDRARELSERGRLRAEQEYSPVAVGRKIVAAFQKFGARIDAVTSDRAPVGA